MLSLNQTHYRLAMVPTLKELKFLLNATVILLMPCLKKIKDIGCLVQNVLAKQIFYQVYLKRETGRSVSLTPVPYYSTRCVGKACQDPPRFTDLCPCSKWLVQHFSNAKIFFLIYFQSVIYSYHASNWQHTIVLLIKGKKKKSLCAFPLLTHSLWIAHSIQPRRRKLGSALD